MQFNKQTIQFKVFLILSIFVLLNLISYIFYIYIQNKIKITETSIFVLTRNSKQIQRAAYYAQRKIIGDDQISDEVNYSLNLCELSMNTLKNGGLPPDNNQQIILPESEIQIQYLFEKNEKAWLEYRKNIETIVNEQLYTNIREQKDTIINNVTSEFFNTITLLNPLIQNSNKKLNEIIAKLTESNDELIDYYNSEKNIYQSIIHFILIITIIFYIILMIVVMYLLKKKWLNHMKQFSIRLDNIIKGNFTTNNTTKLLKDEFDQLFDKTDTINTKLNEVTVFIENLEEENYAVRINNFDKINKLDKALVGLRKQLKNKKLEEERRTEEEKIRRWSVDGQSHFVEILRRTSSDLNTLSDEIVKQVVLFLNASQGGLFIYNDNDKSDIYLELISAFAYDRKKYFTKKVRLGEGLIGMSALEKNLIYLTDIPKDYMEIESGLGEAAPNCILIIPLKTEKDLLGVIEIASFNQLKKYEVDFVQSLAQSIASTLETSRITGRTADLLRESRKKSEELAIRDAEMMSNIQDLRNAQEEALLKEAEMTSIVSAVDKALLKAEFTTEGNFISANRLYISKLGYHFEELINFQVFDFFPKEEVSAFYQTWEKAGEGDTIQLTHRQITKSKSIIWLLSQYTPIKDERNKILRILYLGNDITVQKETEENNQTLLSESLEKAEQLSVQDKEMRQNLNDLLQSQIEAAKKDFEVNALLTAIDNTLIKAELNTTGEFVNVNNKFLFAFGVKNHELYNKNIRELFTFNDLTIFEENWKQILTGKYFQENQTLISPTKNKINIFASYTPIENEQGQVIKIVFLANDNTQLNEIETKLVENEQIYLEKASKIESELKQLEKEKEAIKAKELDLIEKENKKNEKFESENDKKYLQWLNSLKNKK